MEQDVLLKCPICQKDLVRKIGSFLCSNNHCFDISKNNYVNLLLPNQKKTKSPGDDRDMIVARDSFLRKDYYLDLRNSLENLVKKLKPYNILDAGCGTGYYTSNLQNQYSTIGIDISKPACSITSKQNKDALIVVASIFDIPIKDKTIDLILNVFAPKPEEEFKRILRKNGKLIEVVPGKNHLKELKQILFNDSATENLEKSAFKQLKNIRSVRLTYKKVISNEEDLTNLVKMTPYFYKGGKKNIYKLTNMNNTEVTFDFIINILEEK